VFGFRGLKKPRSIHTGKEKKKLQSSLQDVQIYYVEKTELHPGDYHRVVSQGDMRQAGRKKKGPTAI